jgi:hypothetical protein
MDLQEINKSLGKVLKIHPLIIENMENKYYEEEEYSPQEQPIHGLTPPYPERL